MSDTVDKASAWDAVAAKNAEIARLRKGIQDFLDGDYKGARSYRPGKCPHDLWYFNECDSCNDEYFRQLLAVPRE